MLKLQEKDKPTLSFWLIEPQVTIGADVSNSIVLDEGTPDGAPVVIKVEGETLSLVSETNWIRINGKKPAPQQSLCVGDNLQLGHREFVVVDPKVNHKKTESLPQADGWYLWNGDNGQRYEIKNGSVLGRASECSICISEPHLSRRHARFYFADDRLFIEDLQSSNGTFVNNRKIKTQVLEKDDEVRIDKLAFVVRYNVYEDPNRTAVRPIVMADMLVQREAKQAAEKRKSLAPDNAFESKVSSTPAASKTSEGGAGQDNDWRTWLLVGAAVVVLASIAMIYLVVGDSLT